MPFNLRERPLNAQQLNAQQLDVQQLDVQELEGRLVLPEHQKLRGSENYHEWLRNWTSRLKSVSPELYKYCIAGRTSGRSPEAVLSSTVKRALYSNIHSKSIKGLLSSRDTGYETFLKLQALYGHISLSDAIGYCYSFLYGDPTALSAFDYQCHQRVLGAYSGESYHVVVYLARLKKLGMSNEGLKYLLLKYQAEYGAQKLNLRRMETILRQIMGEEAGSRLQTGSCQFEGRDLVNVIFQRVGGGLSVKRKRSSTYA